MIQKNRNHLTPHGVTVEKAGKRKYPHRGGRMNGPRKWTGELVSDHPDREIWLPAHYRYGVMIPQGRIRVSAYIAMLGENVIPAMEDSGGDLRSFPYESRDAVARAFGYPSFAQAELAYMTAHSLFADHLLF